MDNVDIRYTEALTALRVATNDVQIARFNLAAAELALEEALEAQVTTGAAFEIAKDALEASSAVAA
jgi:hypothetical protein